MTIEDMEKRLKELKEEGVNLQALADSEHRSLTDDENTQLDVLLTQIEEQEAALRQRKRLQDCVQRINALDDDPAEERSNRQTAPDKPGRMPNDDSPARIRVGRDRKLDDPKCGYRSMGEYLVDVVRAGRRAEQPDERLTRAALSTYGQESVGAEGGFAIPPAFAENIATKVEGESSLLGATDQITISGNSMTFPKDEATPWGTGGPQANWIGEGGAITQSKPDLKTNTVKAHKIAALVPLTEELQEDAPALEAYVSRRVPMVMGHKIDLAIYSGSGSGQPLGMLVGPGVKSVAKESGQIADTIVGLNVIKMWNGLYAPFRDGAVWLANQDTETQLQQMILTPGLLTDFAVYLPAGGFSQAPYNTLMGRRVIFTQVCETLGDLGDIMLCNLKHYLTVSKGGPRTTSSIHFWFDQDALALKTVMRLGGQPWWDSTIAARDGSATYSAYVALAERA